MPSVINPAPIPKSMKKRVSKTYGNSHILITYNVSGSTGGPMYGGGRLNRSEYEMILSKKPLEDNKIPLSKNIGPYFIS